MSKQASNNEQYKEKIEFKMNGFETTYRVDESSKRKQLTLTKLYDEYLGILAEEFNRTGTKSILLQEIFKTSLYDVDFNDTLSRVERNLNRQLRKRKYDIDRINQPHDYDKEKIERRLMEFVYNEIKEDNERDDIEREELKNDTDSKKTYRFLIDCLNKFPFERGYKSKARESILYCLIQYETRAQRIETKQKLLQMELYDEEFDNPLLDKLKEPSIKIDHIADLIETNEFRQLESWDDRGQALESIYNKHAYHKETLLRQSFKHSDYSDERYYNKRMEEQFENRGMFEHSQVPFFDKQTAIDRADEFCRCQKNRKRLLIDLVEAKRIAGHKVISVGYIIDILEKINLHYQTELDIDLNTDSKKTIRHNIFEFYENYDFLRETTSTEMRLHTTDEVRVNTDSLSRTERFSQ